MKTNDFLFEDAEGLICAVRSDKNDFDTAHEIACKKLFTDNIVQCHDYTHMYYGYGNSDGEVKNSWWLIDNNTKNGIPVYCFREKFDENE
jgi:hypothetical protein